jgi:hypothetical protein
MRVAVHELSARGDDEQASTCRALTGMPSGAEGRRVVRLLDEALFQAA